MERPYRITVRLSEAEQTKLNGRASTLGLSISDTLRHMINTQKSSQPIMTRDDIMEIVVNLKYIQNQIAQNPTLLEAEAIVQELEKLWDFMEKAVNRI